MMRSNFIYEHVLLRNCHQKREFSIMISNCLQRFPRWISYRKPDKRAGKNKLQRGED